MSPAEEERVLTPPTAFREPRWLERRKHLPLYNVGWKEAIRATEGREGDARYHPRLSHADIERIEMETIRDAFEITDKRKPHQRVYWRHVGPIIGASKGKGTEHVYVFYSSDGDVHGLPITLEELRFKGVKP